MGADTQTDRELKKGRNECMEKEKMGSSCDPNTSHVPALFMSS